MASQKHRAFRERLLYRALVFVTALGRRLPLPLGQRLGRAVGRLAWHVVRRERRKSLENLAVAFPEWTEEQRKTTIRAMFRHFGMSVFEIAWLWNMGPELRDRFTTIEGTEALTERINRGQGVVLLTAHCGNWEWLAVLVGLLGHPVSALQRERDNPEMNRYITEFRGRVGVKTIDRGSASSGREIIQAVRRGGILAFLVDQNLRTESVRVPFFGKPAPTPIGPIKLAIRMEAAVVIAFDERRPDGTHHTRFLPPIDCRRSDDPIALTALVTAAIEEQIRRVPEQWVWMHHRWRERPKWDVTPTALRSD